MDEIVRQSFLNGWSHIPSALSMYTYVDTIFKSRLVDISKGHRVVLGKPHGAQAYYIPWKELGLIETFEGLNTSIKMGQVDFVDFTIDILGDALGVAAGIAIGSNDRVWVNIGDATLQMGNTLEAIQFIGQNKIDNIVVTIDWNDAQRCGKCSDIIDIKPVFNFYKENGWDLRIVDGHDRDDISKNWLAAKFNKPTVFVYKTVKGYGYPEMINNIMEWHYKTLDEKSIRQILSED